MGTSETNTPIDLGSIERDNRAGSTPERVLFGFVVIALACLVLSGCGGGFDRQAAVDSFAVANSEATVQESECVVDRLLDSYGIEALELELAADPLDASFEEAQFRAMFACGLEGNVRDQLIEQLEASGVEAADAPCVADGLVGELTDEDIDVLLSGEITDEFFAKFVGAMEACGAINS